MGNLFSDARVGGLISQMLYIFNNKLDEKEALLNSSYSGDSNCSDSFFGKFSKCSLLFYHYYIKIIQFLLLYNVLYLKILIFLYIH